MVLELIMLKISAWEVLLIFQVSETFRQYFAMGKVPQSVEKIFDLKQ